jgi:hypothetical protein
MRLWRATKAGLQKNASYFAKAPHFALRATRGRSQSLKEETYRQVASVPIIEIQQKNLTNFSSYGTFSGLACQIMGSLQNGVPVW